MYGILGNMQESNKGPVLSTESVEYGESITAANNDMAYMLDMDSRTNAVMENMLSIECDIATIRAMSDQGLLSHGHYIDKLHSIKQCAVTLEGEGSEIAALMDTHIEDVLKSPELSVEAYEQKRRSVIDSVINKVWTTVETLISGDTWKDMPGAVVAVFARDSKKEATLRTIKSKLESGELTFKKSVSSSDSLKRMLGGYSLRHKKFDSNNLVKFMDDYFSLIRSGIIDTAISEAYDSLVQSIKNEYRFKPHKPSLAFIESLKNLDNEDILYKDTKLIISHGVTYSNMGILQILQGEGTGDDDGVRYYSDLRKIPSRLYNDLVPSVDSKKDLIKLIDHAIETKVSTRRSLTTKSSQRVAKEWIKTIRSQIATIAYTGLFNILAIRRLLRQAITASKWVTNVNSMHLNASTDLTRYMDIVIILANDCTIKSKKK